MPARRTARLTTFISLLEAQVCFFIQQLSADTARQAAARSKPPHRHSRDHHWQLRRITVFEEKPLDVHSNGAPSVSHLIAKACWGSYVTRRKAIFVCPCCLPPWTPSSLPTPPSNSPHSSGSCWGSPAANCWLPAPQTPVHLMRLLPSRDPNTCPSAQGSPRRTEQHMLFHLLWLQACDINTFSFKFTFLYIKYGS